MYFIAACFNEEQEITDLLRHVNPLVQGYRIVDDGSTDNTVAKLQAFKEWAQNEGIDFEYKTILHTGLPETVKNEAKNMVPDGEWILMLDADERLSDDTIYAIWHGINIDDDPILGFDYFYFQQLEIIDGVHVRTFQKAKMFKKESVIFPLNNIHADDQFSGNGKYMADWKVFHRKTTNKQIKREQEYLDTYQKLLDNGDIDQGRYEWLRGLHHYIR